jgi:hypothetical protein
MRLVPEPVRTNLQEIAADAIGFPRRTACQLKMIAAGVTALFVTTAPLAYAEQAASQDRLTAADWEHLTDARIKIVKAALQLTPDQEKLWPPYRGRYSR